MSPVQLLPLFLLWIGPFVPVLLGATFGPLYDAAVAVRERRALRALGALGASATATQAHHLPALPHVPALPRVAVVEA
jgi:hypothetical protein